MLASAGYLAWGSNYRIWRSMAFDHDRQLAGIMAFDHQLHLANDHQWHCHESVIEGIWLLMALGYGWRFAGNGTGLSIAFDHQWHFISLSLVLLFPCFRVAVIMLKGWAFRSFCASGNATVSTAAQRGHRCIRR